MTGGFWSSVDLTGNQTDHDGVYLRAVFWSSVNLTGNQTVLPHLLLQCRFGAVSI